MFGYVTASWKELDKQQQRRYSAVYCGICRKIRQQTSNLARLGLQYDMAFLALLLMSLYEPTETGGDNACLLHPVTKRPWIDNDCIAYSADMNTALVYYKALDDWADEGSAAGRQLAKVLEKHIPRLRADYPRQMQALEEGLAELDRLEKENCPNPDLPAGAFGRIMGELLVWKQDMWAPTLQQMGCSLGRFIYLLDAAEDYEKDQRKGRYNPFLAMGTGKDWKRWEEYLVWTMGRCSQYYERLPLVQDKGLLDNILYSGVWSSKRGRTGKEEEEPDDRRSV